MAIRIIRQDDDPVLRKISKKVEKIDEKIHILLDDMIETMYDADGVGLAAPQIGILKRIVIIDVGEGLIELINPEIVEEIGNQCETEGCLSLPNSSGEVIRPKNVKVKGLNREGQEVFIEGSGLLARALCHEIDHLNGILFIDRMKNE
ncbi:peptide deformylase Def [Clostridium aceticum]|uniref:Peptide deformylase n=1 Tax=Clostridium aceticum TaxID=84022 RepID=A0A0D8I9E5_9CLOT|nr:peptide deformylase [Clostridium aceticum]AKL95541.1 peptide deformylase Def [Clostridium aceticum]KJF26878.1 peptide deformylase [Clostridium aceticum]